MPRGHSPEPPLRFRGVADTRMEGLMLHLIRFMWNGETRSERLRRLFHKDVATGYNFGSTPAMALLIASSRALFRARKVGL
jgi:hypothetical protein